MIPCISGPGRWAQTEFGSVDLGHRSRNRRVEKVAQAMAARPGLSIPELFPRWGDTKAAYQLFSRPEAEPDALQAPHRKSTLEAMGRPGGTCLLLADTSELVYRRRPETPGLGPINQLPGARGFLLHTTLAVRWPGIEPGRTRRPLVEILGLADQRYEVRVARPEHEKSLPDRRINKTRERESQIWDHGTQAIGPTPEGAQWIDVQDRGADIYEHLRHCQAMRRGFVIRAGQDRRLEEAATGKRCGRLFEAARAAPSLGCFDLELPAKPARPGKPAQPARTARLSLSAVAARLQSPQRPGKAQGALPAIECTAVRAYEEHPPDGAESLEWILLCDATVAKFEEALERVLMYSTRWVIEEFHKGLKTGLGAERLQLESGKALFAAVAIMCVVALRLIRLREGARLEGKAEAERSGFSPLELKALAAASGKPVRTVGEVALALGRLGGHLGRKSDGMPGWITLWRGIKEFYRLLRGIELARELEGFG